MVMFEREDWMLFRNLSTLTQKAGVPQHKLAILAAKELVDNSLDSAKKGQSAAVDLTEIPSGFIVQDLGAGISPDPEVIAKLFSIKRPLLSSKLIRLPARGALGNGLRVVVGTVLASEGSMTVETCGKRFDLYPQDTGETLVETTDSDVNIGTRITVQFGPALAKQKNMLSWSEFAISIADLGTSYGGKTSPWWYDEDAFFELIFSSRVPLEDLLKCFHKVSPKEAKEIADLMPGAISRPEARSLLKTLRDFAPAPKPTTLGKIGDVFPNYGYCNVTGTVEVTGRGLSGEVPYSIDVYAKCSDELEEDSIIMMVNRTIITGEMRLMRQKAHELGIIGSGLRNLFDVGKKKVELIINVCVPYCPIKSDGKDPDLLRFHDPLSKAIKKACSRGRALAPKDESKASQRAVIEHYLEDAIEKASGNGTYRYSLRQLFYAVRPSMLETLGKEPDYNYFSSVITAIEGERGADLPGIYRDSRGTIYHPHTGEEIPLGTLNVERYKRPQYTINSVLFCEKEGLFSILRESGWPERNDCALVSSKGFASRAARDVLDLLGDSDEPIYFYSLHDGDNAGGLIHQSLIEETKARKGRRVHIVNLGIEPWEAVEMGLQVETHREDTAGKRLLPVADYVAAKDDGYWADWLQTKRVELNAMTSPQFISWLDSKFEGLQRKLVPDERVIRQTFNHQSEEAIRQALTAKILKEAGINDLVNAAMQKLQGSIEGLDLTQIVEDGLALNPQHRWDKPLDNRAIQETLKLIAGDSQ
ncbi:hypothetical protein IFT57_06700 [Pseudomonas sp. CFBP 13719]|nr:hypothetical protein [Pseudomonas putida]MBD8681434.1 hypothetical protein [Pseudomonas sp. CFBP 13719]